MNDPLARAVGTAGRARRDAAWELLVAHAEHRVHHRRRGKCPGDGYSDPATATTVRRRADSRDALCDVCNALEAVR